MTYIFTYIFEINESSNLVTIIPSNVSFAISFKKKTFKKHLDKGYINLDYRL